MKKILTFVFACTALLSVSAADTFFRVDMDARKDKVVLKPSDWLDQGRRCQKIHDHILVQEEGLGNGMGRLQDCFCPCDIRIHRPLDRRPVGEKTGGSSVAPGE